MTSISVILPFRNAEATIEAAIKSILGQTFTDFELILIDDNSKDRSGKVIDSFNDSRIKLISNDSMGLVSALNKGIESASGKYIARMDADDYSLPERLFKQFKHLEKSPDNYVSACKVEYQSSPYSTDTSGYQYHVNWLNNIISPADHYNNRFIDAPIAHPTLFCRKETFLKYGLYKDLDHPEDFELWLRWMEQGVKFEKVNQVLFQWSDHPERLSRSHDNYSADNFSRLKAEYFARWWKNSEDKQLWIVGFGKEVFRRSAFLFDHKLEISGYVDIKARPGSQRMVIDYSKIEKSPNHFYLVYVSDRVGKTRIKEFFDKKEMKVGEHYLSMA